MTLMYEYDSGFFDYMEATARKSATHVVPIIQQMLSPRSVLDVGCGAGAWLSVFAKSGLEDYVGVDGPYVRPEQLSIDPVRFAARDVSDSFDLKRTFDLVQCLEVGEHIPERKSGTLVANLVRHGRLVLFSAAVPGQGGENHVNEQSYEFWRRLFQRHGYRPLDALRPRISDIADVDAWYRFNALFYAHESLLSQLPAAFHRTEIAAGQPIPDVAPVTYRLRCLCCRPLPAPVLTRIAIAKHKLLSRRWVARKARNAEA
jgi:SAM-dependent methyltransferase